MALVPRYPQSALVRVRAAGAALHSTPRNLSEALRLYGEARVLLEAGCALEPRDQWLLGEGQGLAHMLGQHFDTALPFFASTAEQFPNTASTRYNLACSYCMTGDVERCRTSFVQTLEMVAAAAHPSWTSRPERSLGHYVRLSAEDSDLAALRATPQYEEAVAPYL